MRVTYCTSEVAPYSKTGGLGDVASALPRALAALGNDLAVVSPWYRCVAEWFDEHPAPLEDERIGPFTFRRTVLDGISLVFVVADELYDRPGLYLEPDGSEYGDNLQRFAHLSRACLEWSAAGSFGADVVHANDWQTSLVPILGHAQAGDNRRLPMLLTIHNLAYQGTFDASALATLGLGPEYFTSETLEFYGRVNLLKGGVVFADWVNTVSPTYAREIQSSEELGCGLDGLLRAHASKLSGILNGIDTALWNPGDDPRLPVAYGSEDLSGKGVCKALLQESLGLPIRSDAVVLGSIGRMDRQKGLGLILEALDRLRDVDLQFVCLGSGNAALEDSVRTLATQQPQRVACRIGFDEELAHLIEAGADMFLMPSLYEPCGLNQMYSQRYGTVPVVRATGGLADTVVHADPARRAAGEGSGFLFYDPTAEGLAGAIREAVEVYVESPAEWTDLVKRIMTLDNSWGKSARSYMDLYESLLG